MPRRVVKAKSFNGVGVAQTATLDLAPNARYHSIVLEYKESGALAAQADLEAAITGIRIYLNGILQRDYRGAKIVNMINSLNGVAFDAGMIPIHFSEPWRRNAVNEDALAWALEGMVSTFQIEVDIAPDATAPSLAAFAVVDNARDRNGNLLQLDGIMKLMPTLIPVSGTGIQAITQLPKTNTYQRIHCQEGAANDITEINVSIDNLAVFQATDARNNFWLDQQGMVPQAGFFHICFDATQRINDGLPMIRADGRPVAEFLVEPTLAIANDFTMHAELLGRPNI